MVRRVRRLLAAVAGTLIAAAAALAPAGPAAAHAATGADRPAAGVDIAGDRLDQPLRLRADVHPTEVSAVLDQVSWLGRTGQQHGPQAADLGPKYTVVVLAGDVATKTYDLYPLAKGGPRIYRPAKQPDRSKTQAGWFFGRLSMSETLRTVGVPLPRQFDTLSGGIGGGERVLPEDALDPGQDLDAAMGELQRLLLLNAGVMVVITVGLAGIALLIRRRTR